MNRYVTWIFLVVATAMAMTSWVSAQGEKPKPPATSAVTPAQQAPSIPSKFLGVWIHKTEDSKSVDTLKVTQKSIEWILTELGGQESIRVQKYTVAPDGATITFTAKVTYSRDVFGGAAHKGDAKVTLRPKDGSMSVEIGGTKTEEAGGVIITTPPKVYLYTKSETGAVSRAEPSAPPESEVGPAIEKAILARFSAEEFCSGMVLASKKLIIADIKVGSYNDEGKYWRVDATPQCDMGNVVAIPRTVFSIDYYKLSVDANGKWKAELVMI